MAKANPQSLWTYDLLWTKARAYMDRALKAPRDSDQFPFWTSLALEFLARAAVANVSPLLLADTSDSDGRNLIYAIGIEPKIKNYIPKSIAMNEVFLRCEQLIPGFTADVSSFCRGFVNKRNEELHSGGTPFNALSNDTWLPRFYEAASLLLKSQAKSLEDLVGKQEAKAAETMLAAVADEAAKNIKKSISAHAGVWNSKEKKERAQLELAATEHAKPHKGHVVKCPSCGSASLVTGEEIEQQPPVLEGDELVVRSIILPTHFECMACGLKAHGHSQLFAAGLGSQFTNTSRFDPVEFYAEDFRYMEGEDYNND